MVPNLCEMNRFAPAAGYCGVQEHPHGSGLRPSQIGLNLYPTVNMEYPKSEGAQCAPLDFWLFQNYPSPHDLGRFVKLQSSATMRQGAWASNAVGQSKSESREATTAKGSSLAAGCFINITAKGTNDGKEDDSDSGDILIQGSTVNAAKNVTLDAKDDIMLFAARNDNETHSTNESSGGSIGVSVGAGQTGITLSANRARVKK